MEEKHDVQAGHVPAVLPWALGAGALLAFLLTLNHWVSLASLPLVAKVAGWDWVLPHQGPLFFLVTYPFRFLPTASQPIALNVFSAVCAALTLALLARSVMLLPHDRTHEQRQRERSEFSLLSIPTAWLPPLFAVLVCGLELTFWEHAVVATGEMLDLLVFAYVVRCLLEYRIHPKNSWLFRFAFVYGLGVTNNWALIGFFPFFVVALAWIRGFSVLQLQFAVRLLACGLAGLSLYLLLPLAWMLSDHPNVTFLDALRANLGAQKSMLLFPGLRSRALVLSLTAVLPVLVMAVRWPATFGDTSAAGSAMTNLMFRVIHVVLFGACLWVAFDQKFSPRALGFGLSFLTFYYLGALSVGYFSGYALLVFGAQRTSKSWRKQSGLGLVLQKVILALVWLAAISVPAALAYKNLPSMRQKSAEALRQMAEACAQGLPAKSAIVLSDDAYALLLLEAHFTRVSNPARHVLVHTRSLTSSDYHLELSKRYAGQWPASLIDPNAVFDDGTLSRLLADLARTNSIYYLHPSFGFYFERFYPRPSGLVSELVVYPTNNLVAMPIPPADIQANQTFWAGQQAALFSLRDLGGSRDAAYVQRFYARALNSWGVALQRNQKGADGSKHFELASELSTNNIPAFVNLAFARAQHGGGGSTNINAKTIEDRFGAYRNWDVLTDNGPFDQPEFCMKLGEIFMQQDLFRQAAIEYQRVRELDPASVPADLGLANVYLLSGRPEEAIAKIREIRTRRGPSLPEGASVELTRLEAHAEYARNSPAWETVLLAAQTQYPKNVALLDALTQLYAKEHRYTNALVILEKLERLAPENTQVQMNRATVYFNTKAYDKALATLDQIIERDPRNVPAQLYKTFVFVQLRDFKKAAPIVESVLRSDPDNIEALTYEGVLAIENKEYSMALPPLNRVLKKEPHDWNALRNRGIAFLQLGNLRKAKEDYGLLAQLMPRYYVAHYGLGEIAYREKDTAAAIRHYERYLANFPPETTPELDQEKKLVTDRLNELKAAGR